MMEEETRIIGRQIKMKTSCDTYDDRKHIGFSSKRMPFFGNSCTHRKVVKEVSVCLVLELMAF